MIRAIISDFSGVLLNAIDTEYSGGLNALYREYKDTPDFDYHQLFRINERLLDFYREVNERVPVYIFTTGYVQEDPAIHDRVMSSVSQVYSAERLGLRKDDPEAYREIALRVNERPEDLFFIDDREHFTAAAESAGYTTILFTTTEEVIQQITNLI